jgi:hypothetical protein
VETAKPRVIDEYRQGNGRLSVGLGKQGTEMYSSLEYIWLPNAFFSVCSCVHLFQISIKLKQLRYDSRRKYPVEKCFT